MTGDFEDRVLVCAPHGRDADLIVKMLGEQAIRAQACLDLPAMLEEMSHGVGVILMTEEALAGCTDLLVRAMEHQPPWSDLPLIMLTTDTELSVEQTWSVLRSLHPLGNVSLLERPLRGTTLVSAVQVALRSRHRQYEVRSLYDEMEHRVDERTAELKRLNEEAEGFSYTIAHDLRSPLRAISATSGVLLEDYAEVLPENAVSELKRQAEAAKRMAKLIDDLLELSKLSREQMKPRRFDFTALAEEVVNDVRKELPQCRCSFVIQPQITAFGDRLLLRFALLNLVQNACKFSPGGGEILIGQDSGHFYVSDHGIGFSLEYAEKVFLPFERLVNGQRFPGTGIGLTNVKRIVERHRGKIWVDSAPGKGTTFYFTLPAVPST